MSFEDLPSNWPTRPLTDPVLAADVVDLVVRDGDRAGGCIVVLLCDGRHRMLQPVPITDIGHESDPRERHAVFDLIIGELADHIASFVLAVGRPHGRDPDDEARGWHEAAIQCSRAHGVPLVGTYLATADTVVEMPRWEEPSAVSRAAS